MTSKELRLPNYGGQALIEGVLMRGKKSLAAAFRLPDGQIKVQSEELGQAYKNKIFSFPFIRGLLVLGDALALGYKYLTISANFQVRDDEKIEGSSSIVSMLLAITFSVLVFFLLPALLSKWIADLIKLNSYLTNLFEGIIRLGLIIGYLSLIRRIPEILNVFRYHGAEHKTINAFEAGAKLEPEIVENYSMYHPRCGTSFILTVALISLIVFTLLGSLSLPVLILSRILLIAPIIMLSYEYVRWLGDHMDNTLVKLLAVPNLKLQELTTEEPTLEIIEVSISAFNRMYELENLS